MKKKHWIILSAALVLAAIVTIWAVAAHVSNNSSRSGKSNRRWQAQYDLGVRYLNEGNYEEAVIAFSASIKIERRAEAYAGRAEAYMGLGDYEKAVDDYDNAVERSFGRDDEILFKEGLARAYVASGNIDKAEEIYEELYDETDDEKWLDRIDALRDPGSLSGVVYAWGPDMFTPVTGAQVTVLNRETNNIVYSIITWENGTFEEEIPGGDYQLFVHSPEYQSTKVNVLVKNGESISAEPIYLLSKEDVGGIAYDQSEENKDGDNNPFDDFLLSWQGGREDPSEDSDSYNRSELCGVLTNALNGQPLSGAKVGAIEGWNQENLDDDNISWSETDNDGSFEIADLKVGYYTLFVECEGYLSTRENVVVSMLYKANWKVTLTPELNSGEQLRVVLTWGELPYDLDSHLIIDGDSSLFSSSSDVFYNNMFINNSRTGNEIAMLDVDDISSYGPETETIFEMSGHSFTYMVYDFSSAGDPANALLNRSGATVSVYGDNGLIAEYHVPTVAEGSYWEVFSVDERGSITSINDLRTTLMPD